MPPLTQDEPGRWAPRSEAVLVEQRLHAVRAWHEARRRQEEAARTCPQSREQRVDVMRHLDVLRQEHSSIISRTEQHLQESARQAGTTGLRRAVVAHRNDWYVDKLVAALAEHLVEVVARLDNGAHAVGAAIAEQPDLMLVEDSLPMLSGVDVVREVRAYAPGTVVAAQVAYDEDVAEMLDAGARAVYTRRVPPAEVALGLWGLPAA